MRRHIWLSRESTTELPCKKVVYKEWKQGQLIYWAGSQTAGSSAFNISQHHWLDVGFYFLLCPNEITMEQCSLG